MRVNNADLKKISQLLDFSKAVVGRVARAIVYHVLFVERIIFVSLTFPLRCFYVSQQVHVHVYTDLPSNGKPFGKMAFYENFGVVKFNKKNYIQYILLSHSRPFVEF